MMNFNQIVLFIFGSISILIGIVIVYGIRKGWNVLIHPPHHISGIPIWPYSLVRGTRFEKYIGLYNLVGGIVGIIVGTLFILIAIFKEGP
jgi:hypothetical protein